MRDPIIVYTVASEPYKDPIIVYTVISEPYGYRTQRMALHPDVPARHTQLRRACDERPYRIAWKAACGAQWFSPWRKSCLGADPGELGPVIGDGSTEAALAWLLEGESHVTRR